MDPDALPTPEHLQQLAQRAATLAGVQLVSLHVGAYIRSWDNTLFEVRTKLPASSG